MTREGLIEAMARAIREMRDRPHSSYADEARAALAALEAHAAVVPREPDERMKVAGGLALERILFEEGVPVIFDAIPPLHRALIAVSPFAPEKEARDE